jgi:hypothetical protein
MSSGLHTGLRLLGNITLLGEFCTLDVRASVLDIEKVTAVEILTFDSGGPELARGHIVSEE